MRNLRSQGSTGYVTRHYHSLQPVNFGAVLQAFALDITVIKLRNKILLL